MKWLVVGLGNPGDQYENTRHNAGFILADRLAKELNLGWRLNSHERVAEAKGEYGDKSVLIIKPQTYMNASGGAVVRMAIKEEVLPARIIVLSDDVNLPLGTVRVRSGGSAGGHNGLASIVDRLGEEVARIRVGVGEPVGGVALENYVLERFSKSELLGLEKISAITVPKILLAIKEGVVKDDSFTVQL